MRKNDDDDVDEVRADIPRRIRRPLPSLAPSPTAAASCDDDKEAAVTAAALSWSVRGVITSGIPQRPDAQGDTVRLKVLHAAVAAHLRLLHHDSTVLTTHHPTIQLTAAFTTQLRLPRTEQECERIRH